MRFADHIQNRNNLTAAPWSVANCLLGGNTTAPDGSKDASLFTVVAGAVSYLSYGVSAPMPQTDTLRSNVWGCWLWTTDGSTKPILVRTRDGSAGSVTATEFLVTGTPQYFETPPFINAAAGTQVFIGNPTARADISGQFGIWRPTLCAVGDEPHPNGNFIPRDETCVSHCIMRANAPQDLMGRKWTVVGSPVTCKPGGIVPTALDTQNGYGELPASEGSVDFTGDFMVTVIFQTPRISVDATLFTNGTLFGTGYGVYVQGGTNVSQWLLNNVGLSDTGNALVANGLNVGVFGRRGTTLVMRINRGTIKTNTNAAYAYAGPPATLPRIGRGSVPSTAAWVGLIHEICFAARTPTDAVVNAQVDTVLRSLGL